MRKLLTGVCLCTAASGVAALSLGPSRGVVVLGSPIDLMFEVRPDPGQDLASSCLSAQMVLGSQRLSDARVQVTPVLGGPSPMVRVQTRVVADEPVLTVTLAAGCQGRVTRTYTFLVDPPASAAATHGPVDRTVAVAPRLSGGAGFAAAVTPAIAENRPRDLAGRVPAHNADGQAVAIAGGSARPQTRRQAAAAQTPAARPRVRTLAAAPQAAPTAGPRLLVEPLDLWLDTPLTLRLTRNENLTLSPVDEGRRAEAAALWKTLSTSPEDLQQAMAQLDRLQADAKAHAAQLAAERATAAGLRERLEQAQRERYGAGWVYGLGGLLALAVGGMAWLLRRQRGERERAWSDSVARSAAGNGGGVVTQGPDGQEHWQVEPDAADTWIPSAPLPEQEHLHLPVDAPDTIPVEAAEPEPPAPAPRVQRAQQIAPPEALFDIQQQAEFYISIGEHEQAIEVLRAYIQEQGDAMPWAYLEALRLFHMLGRPEDFRRLRAQFEERFNVRIPDLAQFHDSGRTLEDYPEALAQIEAQWSSPEAMAVLDGFLFRRDHEHVGESFDLAAFDDLLLLLAIVQTTPAHLRGAPPPRARTTPRAGHAALPADRSLDSIAGDLSLMPSGYDGVAPEPVLDVDLSQARVPDIALGGGPGIDDDGLDLRLELAQMDPKRP